MSKNEEVIYLFSKLQTHGEITYSYLAHAGYYGHQITFHYLYYSGIKNLNACGVGGGK
jgi:hypothetical protein